MPEEGSPFPELGLSPAQQALYESLVAAPGGVPAEAAATADFARLAELGLVNRLSAKPPRWVVVEPDAAFAPLLADRRQSLRQLRQRVARLGDRYQQTAVADHTQFVEVLHGRMTVRAAFVDLMRGARHEVLMCDAPPYVGSLGSATVEREPLGRGVRMRTLYDRESVAMPGRLTDLAGFHAAGEQARVTDVPMKLVLCDRRLALLPLRTHPVEVESSLLVRDSVLLSALAALFESSWERAVPLDLGTRQATPSDAPSDGERDLLALLVAGLTDPAIAEHLGCTVRTVTRHTRRLFTRLNAATRFQAGYQAVQRGWLTADDGGVA